MRKMKCTIAYDGSGFKGFQAQPNKRTIQGEIEHALQKMHKGKMIRIHPAGRTDAGVHALAQVFHFETTLQIKQEDWRKALYTLLPDDIEVIHMEEVADDFHARYDAVGKVYQYKLLNKKERNVFTRNYVYYSPHAYDVSLLKETCKVFVGTHDFTSFSAASSEVKGPKVRTLTKVDCEKYGDMIVFSIEGNGFLRHMVRIIVGAILEVGRGKKTVQDLRAILDAKDRTKAGITISPVGLYLVKVVY